MVVKKKRIFTGVVCSALRMTPQSHWQQEPTGEIKRGRSGEVRTDKDEPEGYKFSLRLAEMIMSDVVKEGQERSRFVRID